MKGREGESGKVGEGWEKDGEGGKGEVWGDGGVKLVGALTRLILGALHR